MVRNSEGQVLLASRGADVVNFPPNARSGFVRTDTHQLYYEASPNGRLTIAVGDPLDRRTELSRKMLLGLLLPLVVVIPFSLFAIILVVRRSLGSIRGLGEELAHRGPQDLSPLLNSHLPSALRTPVAGAIAQAQRIRAETSEEATGRRATGIEATLKRLMRMSEKLMQLARAEGDACRAMYGPT